MATNNSRKEVPFAKSFTVKTDAKPMSFAVGEKDVPFVCFYRTLVADEPLRLVELILSPADERYFDTGVLQHVLCGVHLALPPVHDEHARQGPLIVSKPPRKRLFERRDVVIRGCFYFEHSVRRLYGFTPLYDRQDRHGLRATRVRHVECLDTDVYPERSRRASRRDPVLVFDERHVAYVSEGVYLSSQLRRLLESLRRRRCFHFAHKFPLQALEIPRKKPADVFDALRVFSFTHPARTNPRTQSYLPVETRFPARGRAGVSERKYPSYHFERLFQLSAMREWTIHSC